MTTVCTFLSQRSLCTLVCKWTYIGHTPSGGQQVVANAFTCHSFTIYIVLIFICHLHQDSDVSRGWNESFWQEVGLADFVEEGYSRIGTVCVLVCTCVQIWDQIH